MRHQHGEGDHRACLAIDLSPAMVEAARERVRKEGLERLIEVRQADAHRLPFEDASFDVVLIECVTTLVDRARAFAEFQRVLKSGGYLGDLEMIYRREPAEPFARRLREEWEGFTTMPLAGWLDLLHEQGLEVAKVDDFSERMTSARWTMLKELGPTGVCRMVWRLLRRPAIARRLSSWDRLFKEGDGVFGYAYFVAQKPRAG